MGYLEAVIFIPSITEILRLYFYTVGVSTNAGFEELYFHRSDVL